MNIKEIVEAQDIFAAKKMTEELEKMFIESLEPNYSELSRITKYPLTEIIGEETADLLDVVKFEEKHERAVSNFAILLNDLRKLAEKGEMQDF